MFKINKRVVLVALIQSSIMFAQDPTLNQLLESAHNQDYGEQLRLQQNIKSPQSMDNLAKNNPAFKNPELFNMTDSPINSGTPLISDKPITPKAQNGSYFTDKGGNKRTIGVEGDIFSDKKSSGYNEGASKLNQEKLTQEFGEGSATYSFPDPVDKSAKLNQEAQSIVKASEQKLPSVAPIVANKKEVDYKQLEKIQKEREEAEKFFARRNQNLQFMNKDITYSFKDYENRPVEIYLKRGYISQIEFVDEMHEPIRITSINVGNKLFNINKPAQNIITLEPVAQYRFTNMNIRLNGYESRNITFKVIESEEGYENMVDNLVRIVVTEGTIKDNTSMSHFKTQIIKELFQYGTLRGQWAKKIPYSVYDKSKNSTTIRHFNPNDLTIYQITKSGKKMILVQLNNKYEVLGAGNKEFGRYANSYEIYFLPFTKGVIDIIKKLDKPGDTLSNPDHFESDIGLGEIYQIVLEN